MAPRHPNPPPTPTEKPVSKTPEITPPADAQPITLAAGGGLQVPDVPVVPFIEGDGTGPDIWRATSRVLEAAVEKAYDSKRRLGWVEVYAGQKAYDMFGSWLPDETLDAFRSYLVGIKGPLTTPIGGGIRSLNVALRQILDLYVCLRPVRWFQGVPSPTQKPAPGRRHGDLPREHRGHLRRDRVPGGIGADREVPGPVPPGVPRRVPQDPLPGHLRHRHQAGLARGHRAARARGHPLRPGPEAQERHVRPQGQHHEVHRGRLPQLGLRAGREASSPTTSTPGSSGAAPARKRARRLRTRSRTAPWPRARSWSRTPSRTSRCSRC